MGSIPVLGTTILVTQQSNSYYADVAESADALVSGTSGGDIVEVQVLSSAPFLCLLLFFDIFAVVAELADALL